MSTDGPEETQILERVRAAARMVVALGDPPSLEALAAAACRCARSELGCDAAVFFFGEAPRRIAVDGLVLEPPDGVPASFENTEQARLREWGLRAGYLRIELAPLIIDARAAGLIVLLTRADGPRLAAQDLETLGAGLAAAVANVCSNTELRRAYEKRDRDQDQAVRNERLRALGEMALGIAHDFNNVLNAILAQAGVLQRLADGRAELLGSLEKLRLAALEGGSTVERVQEFSRQRRDQEFTEVALAGVVRERLALIEPRLPIGIVLQRGLDGEAAIRGSREQLGDVIAALVDNAVDAMPQGGRLSVELSQSDADVTLVVSDTGRGMSREVRRRAFDPFFTTKGSRVKGLGLSVAFGIVRRHGGRIDLDSTPGKGTRVRVRLPRLRPAAVVAPAAAPPARPPASGAPLRVLLVEDDPDNREAMASLLELSGYQVTAAESGSAGVRMFADATFDVVITDLGLPDMNGWEVAGTIKASAPSTPIALITGWGFNLEHDEIRRRGVDLLVKKPIDPQRFLAQLEGLAGALRGAAIASAPEGPLA